MKYLECYERIITRAKHRKLDGPTESHHVIPRCMGGSDGKKNRVLLTPEEHYVAHQLLIKIYPDVPGLALAAVMMARDNRNGKRCGNKLYGWLRRRAARENSERLTGIPCPEDRRLKISEAQKNSPRMRAWADSRRGVPRLTETRALLSEAHKTSAAAIEARSKLNASKIGVPRSEETKHKLSIAFTGRTISESQRIAVSKKLSGVPKTAEHNAKVSAALKGNQNASGAVRSPETRAKMRLAAIAREAAKRAAREAA